MLTRTMLSTLILFSISFHAIGKTALTKKAASLKLKMSRVEVIKLLGKPTWAILPSDKGELALPKGTALELYWSNTGCGPVIVMFNKAMQATGWDQGQFCMEGAGAAMNPKERSLSCKNKDRKIICQ